MPDQWESTAETAPAPGEWESTLATSGQTSIPVYGTTVYGFPVVSEKPPTFLSRAADWTVHLPANIWQDLKDWAEHGPEARRGLRMATLESSRQRGTLTPAEQIELKWLEEHAPQAAGYHNPFEELPATAPLPAAAQDLVAGHPGAALGDLVGGYGGQWAIRKTPALAKGAVREAPYVWEGTKAGVPAAAPDVLTGAGKIAAAEAVADMFPGVPRGAGGIAAAMFHGGLPQIIRGLGKGWRAGLQAYQAAKAAGASEAAATAAAQQAAASWQTGFRSGTNEPGATAPPPGAAPSPDEPPAPPPEEPPQQPPDEGGGTAAPAAATPPDDEPPGGGGGATAVPPAAAAAQTAADELQARRVAEAQQAAADINPRTEGFKERNRIKRQPAVQKFGDWLMGQGYSGDMAEAISEGTKQNLERWRMMAQQAGTDTPTPSGFRDVVKHIRAQEAAAKAAATQQSPAPPPAQPAAPEAPPKSLEEIIAAEAARRAEAARATAESMRLMRDRPYGY